LFLQAAACIEQLDLTVAEYLKSYEKESEMILGFAPSGATSRTVLNTWNVSLDKMKKADAASAGLALRVLEVRHYLHFYI